jgi:hypothetical protein
MRLILNNAEQVREHVPVHWGELLATLELDANRRGEVVTAVRFDGVDQPTFRQLALVQHGLTDVKLVELETASQDDLLDDALAAGASAATALAVAAGQIGSMFRRDDAAAASRRMTEFGDGIRSLTWILGAVATAREVGVEQMECNGRLMSAQLADLAAQLGSIVEAQRSEDWMTVADILEYDFRPALLAWQPIFEGLRRPSAASRPPGPPNGAETHRAGPPTVCPGPEPLTSCGQRADTSADGGTCP